MSAKSIASLRTLFFSSILLTSAWLLSWPAALDSRRLYRKSAIPVERVDLRGRGDGYPDVMPLKSPRK